MSKKFKILRDETIKVDDKTLYRIQALKDFSDVKKGDKGGYIQSHKNLSHDGNCWIYGNGQVFGNAKVFGNAEVYTCAKVYGDAKVFENAKVYEFAKVSGNAEVYGDAKVY